jgi:hypothetical protein
MAETTKKVPASLLAAGEKDQEATIVHGTLTVHNERRTKGQLIKKSEIGAKMFEQLVRDGLIEDADAPLTVKTVNVHVADHFLEVLQKLGLITQNGPKFTFNDKLYVGRDALRDAISVETAKQAIVDFVAQKNAAIAELLKKATPVDLPPVGDDAK